MGTMLVNSKTEEDLFIFDFFIEKALRKFPTHRLPFLSFVIVFIEAFLLEFGALSISPLSEVWYIVLSVPSNKPFSSKSGITL